MPLASEGPLSPEMREDFPAGWDSTTTLPGTGVPLPSTRVTVIVAWLNRSLGTQPGLDTTVDRVADTGGVLVNCTNAGWSSGLWSVAFVAASITSSSTWSVTVNVTKPSASETPLGAEIAAELPPSAASVTAWPAIGSPPAS